MAGSQISTSVSIIDNLKGYQAISLTEYNTSAAAAIAAGSVVEIAGAFFTFSGDETPTGWSSISTGSTAYIALTASGTAGSQVVNAAYTATAPTWRDDLQGWYASAASSVRIVASVYKAGSTSYYPKKIIEILNSSNINIQHGYQVFTSSGSFIVPNNVTSVYLTGCAAGGNGGNGGSGSGNYLGGGGGGGEIIYKKKTTVIPNQIIPVTIGAVGSVTMFGSVSLNYGANGGNAAGAPGSFGAGGALSAGSEAGANGGSSGGAIAASSSFSGGGGTNGSGYNAGGGGSIGMFSIYRLSTSGVAASTSGGSAGLFGGGGGSGGTGTSSTTGGVGGNGGYGGGGGGGGASVSGSGGAGGSGGPGIIIVEW